MGLLPLDLLAGITAAAARLTPAAGIGKALGLTEDHWRGIVRRHREAVGLAIAAGRTEAQLRINSALLACSRFGKTDATLYVLEHHHGWAIKSTPAKPRRRRAAAPNYAPPST
jgi:hypothetical protein